MNPIPRELPFKKVGRQVLFIETDEKLPRAGEGAFIRLKDGTIMHAYSEYFGQGDHDHDAANIAVIYSYDQGETWQDKRIMIEKDPEALNVMSVSFLRLQNDEILMFYSRKIEVNGRVFGRKQVIRSSDEGKTWSEPLGIWVDDRYNHILNNDRVIQLKSGRIVVPFAKYDMRDSKSLVNGALMFLLSDDNGYTWYDSGNHLEIPFEDRRGYEEPGLYQHEDGTLWCYTRTDVGCQFEYTSDDGGITWSRPRANIFFTGTRAPILVKRVCGKYTVAVFSSMTLYTGRNRGKLRGRSPYLLAVSENDGVGHDEKAFTRLYYLEDDVDNDYAYPAIMDGGDYLLVAYYHSNGREKPLNCLKIVKVDVDEITE